MGHSFGDGIIVAALAAAFVAYLYFKHAERQRRLDILHQERLAAMEKGIPLPELPLEPAPSARPGDPHAPLLHGLVWSAFGFGSMLALYLLDWRLRGAALWPLPLPLALLGVGLMLYYALTVERER